VRSGEREKITVLPGRERKTNLSRKKGKKVTPGGAGASSLSGASISRKEGKRKRMTALTAPEEAWDRPAEVAKALSVSWFAKGIFGGKKECSSAPRGRG